MKLFYRILLFITITVTHAFSVAQDSTPGYPEIGKPCPDFLLKNISYYKQTAANLSAFKGKWLVVDFWNKFCTSCVKSFPETNKLQEEFGNKVQFILAGLQDPENEIKPLYARFMQKENLRLAVSFDSLLFKRFDIGPCPYILVIDESGVVRAITTELNGSTLKDLLAGKSPPLFRARNNHEFEAWYKSFDNSRPILINGNGGNDTSFIYRSVLSGYEPGLPLIVYQYISSRVIHKNLFQVTGAPLVYLYQLAYGDTLSSSPGEKFNSYGDSWYLPVAEVKDSTLFTPLGGENQKFYCYSLSVPPGKANPVGIRQVMQGDLKNYFGYNVTVEKRMMPCWELVATEKAKQKLATKGEATSFVHTKTGFSFKNKPVAYIINNLAASFPYGPPFIDNTGFTGNIDITVNAVLNDFDEFKKGLKENGIELVSGQKEMKVIVISDPGIDKNL